MLGLKMRLRVRASGLCHSFPYGDPEEQADKDGDLPKVTQELSSRGKPGMGWGALPSYLRGFSFTLKLSLLF